jgi:hypothetical protein
MAALLPSAQLLPAVVDTLEHGISKLLVIQAAAVEVAQTHQLMVADYEYLAVLVSPDKDSQVVAEYASTMTAKIHTMVAVVAVPAVLGGQVKTKTNKLLPTAAQEQPAIS